MNRKVLISIGIVALALAQVACSPDAPQAAAPTATQAPPPLPAEVQAVGTAMTAEANTATIAGATSTAADPTTLVSTGEFVSPVRSELAPKIGGRVARMHVEEGSVVRQGQPVLELETDYLRLGLQQAQAELARATAASNEAARDLERKKELVAKNAIPRATFDRSQANAEGTQASRAAAAAQVALLRQQLADSTVRSPISGVVAQKRTDVGQRLGDGNVAVVVVQLSPLKLRFSVPERYLGTIGRGDRVVARVDPYPDQTFEGTIRTVGGVIDPATRTMFAEAEFPNRDGRLRPGLFARVEAKLN